jgi:16S rRNA (guanine1207-N2)-methyltransferase
LASILQDKDNRGKISTMTDENPAFSALWQPFLTGAIAWREPALFLRARSGSIPAGIKAEQIDCQQSFKPFADELERAGFPIIQHIRRAYPIVLVLPPPQRDETRALFAQALQSVSEDGLVVVSMQNSAGAKSGEKDLRQLAPNLQSTSKNKCRVFWVNKNNVDEALLQSWLKLDSPRMMASTGFISRPGIFAWDRIDEASKLLTEHLPKDLAGHGADLGAGFGYLTHTVLSQCENIKAMDVYEAEARALECAKSNLAAFEKTIEMYYCWHDVAQGVQGPYDFVISNPPFHQGGVEVQAVGQAFIEAAAKSLKPNGRFYMVANRHLPYEAGLKKYFSRVNVLAMRDGFKVFAAIK